MAEGNTGQEFRLKNIEEIKNYLIKEIDQKELMSIKQKENCATLNYIKDFLVIFSAMTRCISIADFASLLGIPIGITSSEIGLKICPKTVGIKKYKSIIK